MIAPAFLLSTSITIIAVADRVPSFNIDPNCRAAASASIAVGDDYEKCRQAEQGARDDLAKQWSGFAATDRTTCASLANIGGRPSYVELLTCLEMMRDARKLPKEPTDSTVGQRRR